MKILGTTESKNIGLTIETNFKPDAGREESLQQFEDETLRDIINPVENYETIRFIHSPYTGLTSDILDKQSDIWYYMYFYHDTSTHLGGLDYSLIGITPNENAKMLKQSTKTFFRLEFFKVPEGEQPERSNRRFVFAKDLSLPLSEKVFYPPVNNEISVPIFTGSNFRNSENMFLYWFQDESALDDPILTGNTFYMTVRFFNADDGSIINFGNNNTSGKTMSDTIVENTDLYYLMEIDRTDYSYQIYEYYGVKGNRIGMSGNPIKFYEISGG